MAVALGSLDFVPDAVGADRLLVVTTDADGVPVVVDTAGLTVTPQPVVDETRRLAAVSADRLDVTEALRFDGDPEAQVRRLLDRAAVAIACDSLGLSEAMLSATVPTRRSATSSIARSGLSRRSNTPAPTCW